MPERPSRIHARFPGSLTVQVERDGVRRFCLLSDVSVGGAFIEMSPSPPPGARVTVRITRSDGSVTSLPALVRYVRSERFGLFDVDGVGVSWEALSDEGRALVDELVGRASRAEPLRDTGADS